jgi:MSHA biogenesis protein MshQ
MITRKWAYGGNTLARFFAAGLLPVLTALLLSVSSAQATTDVLTASGTWTAPAGVTSVTVEAWGGGGGGGRATGNPAKGGGGAGGQYASKVVAVTPGNSYAVVVGTGGAGGVFGSNNGTAGGDSTFATNVVVAKGGAGGTAATTNGSAGAAGAGSMTGGVGTTVYAGGDGSSGIPTGGAGGGGAGSGGAGGNASGDTAGMGTAAGGGAGATATTGGSCTNVATVAGGGGCGGYATSGTNRNGGDGAAGMVAITYGAVTTGTVTGSPTLCVNDTSIGVVTGNWTGLGNVGTQNNIYATASVANSDITNYLKCTGYAFSIPAGATITGITVGPWLNATFTMHDYAMQLVKGGAIQATNLATGANIPNGGGTLAASPTQFIYGSSTDLWGNTWTPADINSATFGAAFAAQRGGFASTQQAAVDAMPITVDYTMPSTPTITSIDLASTNPSSPATAVSWTVTFSTSVTGVAAGNFALVQSGGVTGATITSVTGSGTTWTVNANTGSGYGTLGLNMTSVTGISPAITTAMPFVGQVYTISAPMTCITDNFSTGTLDPTLWSVKTILGPYLPQVINAGGGDYRLRLTDTQNNEATFAQLNRTFPAAGNKVVLEIDYLSYGGSGADGIAVTFSDATISSTTGGFGGSLGYAQNNTNPGFGGGWLGIGLDEYGNYPCNNESRTGYPAGWTDPILGPGATVCTGSGGGNHYVAIRGSGSGTTGYNLLANTGLIAATAPATGAAGTTPYRYRITLDHSDSVHAYVTVERDITGTGNSYTTLVPKFDVKASSAQANVPANWLISFTGSTGGATNNHEFKRVQVCANTIIGSGPDHLEIDHPSGTGLTCTPSTLTIKACADAACTTAFTSGLTGTLSAAGTTTVNWSGGSGFSIPAGSSTVTKDVQVTTPGTTVFSATSSPAAATATTCNFGAPSCTFTSSDSGFLVSAPNHVAESASTLTVQAVKKADNSLACVPAFASTSKSVNLKCAYSNPATGTLPVRVSGTPLNATASSTAACDGAGANVTLNFDATGTATPTLQYADVGQMSISAAYTGIPGSLDAGLSMTGTGTFIAAPASFSFSGLPAGPIKAGNPFSATVTALNALGNATPNFGKETSPGPAGVTLTSTLVSPVGGANPTPGNNVIPGTEFGAGGMVNDPNGVATVNNLSWGEVGSISLLATLTNTYGYLGTAGTPTRDALNNLLIASGNSAAVGAFIPDHFDTAVVATAIAPLPCPTSFCPTSYNGFVYSGQPFSMQVTAKNLAGGTTTNYHSAYGLSNNVTLTAWDAIGSVLTQNPPGGANAGALAINPILSTAFNHGVGTTNTQAYTFANSPTSPTNIFLRAVDAVNTSVTSRLAIPANSVEGGVQVVSGKVKVSNAHGSETLDLPMNASIQYYDGAFWRTSLTDSVTSLTLSLSNYQRKTGGAWTTTPTPANGTVIAGILKFILSAPTGGGTGSVDVGISLPTYLLSGSNVAGVDPNQPGRATFGVYKGSSKFIYRREDY